LDSRSMLNMVCFTIDLSTSIFLVQDNVLVVDREFRDCLDAMERLGMELVVPSFLQFSCCYAKKKRICIPLTRELPK